MLTSGKKLGIHTSQAKGRAQSRTTQVHDLKSQASLLRAQLNNQLREFLLSDAILFRDPLDCLSINLNPNDGEILSFIIAGLSYGRVEQIKKSSQNMLEKLRPLGIGPHGEGIANFLQNENAVKINRVLSVALDGWKHRLNNSRDLLALFDMLSSALKNCKSLAHMFQKSAHGEPKEQIDRFVLSLRKNAEAKAIATKPSRTRTWQGTGPQWFAPSPSDGGTCKRLLMWLRWMVRKDEFDRGYWSDAALLDSQLPKADPKNLFVPVDTHILQWALREKIISTRSPSWKVVEEITNYFRAINPEDPLKYDFMLCHLGMSDFRSGLRNTR